MNLYLARLNDLLLKHLTPALWVNDRLYELDQLNGYRDVGFDFDVDDLTADEKWHYLDLSSIVGAHETLVRLYLYTSTALSVSSYAGAIGYAGEEVMLENNVDTVIPYDSIMPGFTDGIESLSNHAIVVPVTGYYDINASVILHITSAGEVDNWFNVVRCDTPKQAYPNYDIALIKKFRRLSSGTDEDWIWFSVSCMAYLTKDHYLYATVSSHWDDASPSYISDFFGDGQLSTHLIKGASGAGGSIQFKTYGHTNEAMTFPFGTNQQVCVKTDASGVIQYKITGSPSTLNIKILGWRPVYVIGG